MAFLVATDTCQSLLDGDPEVARRVAQHRAEMHLSVIAVFELENWLIRTRKPSSYTQAYIALWGGASFLDVTEAIAHRASSLSRQVRGSRLTHLNLLTAATAIDGNLTFVTRHHRLFSPVPGLVVENWTVP